MELHLKVFNSETNFILFYCERLPVQKLEKKEILIRDCSDYEGLGEGYYRIAVRERKDNEILIDALKEILEKGTMTWKD